MDAATCEAGDTTTRAETAQPPARRIHRLMLVDDHELVRLGIRSLHVQVDGVPIEWIELGSLDDAITRYAADPGIDAVLLDLNLPDSKGLQGLRRFLQVHPGARIIVFSATQDEFVVRQAMSLGAIGYVGKSGVLAQLRDTLASALGTRAAPRMAAAMAPVPGTLQARCPSTAMRISELGPRHLEVLELVLSGCSNREICSATNLTLGTVKNYVSSLLLTLDVTSRAHLVSLFR